MFWIIAAAWICLALRCEDSGVILCPAIPQSLIRPRGPSTRPRCAWQPSLKNYCRCLSRRFFACEEKDDRRIPRRAALEERRSLSDLGLELGWPKFAQNSGKKKKLRAVVSQMARPRNRAEKDQFSRHVACCGTWCKAPSSFEVFSNPTTKDEPRMPSAMLLQT